MTVSTRLILRASLAIAAALGSVHAAAQESAEHPGTLLASGAVLLEPADVPRTLAALWDCPSMDDEFEQRRCEETLEADRAYARGTVFVGVTGATLGRYDFERHRFPVHVMGIVGNAADPEWLARRHGPERERWAVTAGSGAMMMVGPSPIRSASVRSDLGDWMDVARGYITFDDDETAERWRDSLPSDDGDASVLGAMLVFRVSRTWTVREPPTGMDRLLRESLRTSLGRLADRLPPLRGETYAGVQIRILGWAVLGPTLDARREVLISDVVARRSADRRVAASTIEMIRARLGGSGAGDGEEAPEERGPEPGVLSAEELRTTVERERPGLALCWESAIRGVSPVPHVHLDVTVGVGASGAVTSVTVTGEGLGTLTNCIERTVSRWRFPDASAECSASFPLMFGPADAEVPPP